MAPSAPLDATLPPPGPRDTHHPNLGDETLAPTSATLAKPAPAPASNQEFEILSVLGRGGMGVVFKARQLGLNRVVALKMLNQAPGDIDSEQRIRFQIEAEAVAKLRHPHIVQVFEFGIRDGSPFLAIEYLEGGSLLDRIAKSPPTPRESAELLLPLAQAIHYAHRHGIVHRDLKPANILFTDLGVPKVVDFGLAKRLDALQDATQDGRLLGTPTNMAPEQAMGESSKVGPLTDVYALGTILYHLLTGEPALHGESLTQTLTKIVECDPVPPSQRRPGIPRDLETICLKCLNKCPEQRYASAQDLADDVERFLKSEPIRARRVPPLERGWLWIRRNPAWASVIALTFALIAGVLGWVVSAWREAEHDRLEMIARHRQYRLTQAKNFILFINELRSAYATQIVEAVEKRGIEVCHNYRDKDGAIPDWFTFVGQLAKQVSQKKAGHITRIYSDYPFPWRKNAGPSDEFERTALKELRANPEKAYYRFTEYEGKSALRYAAADVMLSSCVQCHNAMRESPKRDWKVGDVRGVLEVILIID